MKHAILSPVYSFGALPLQPWYMRRRWQLLGLLLILFLLVNIRVQAGVVLPVGTAPGASYPTIGVALAAVTPPLT